MVMLNGRAYCPSWLGPDFRKMAEWAKLTSSALPPGTPGDVITHVVLFVLSTHTASAW